MAIARFLYNNLITSETMITVSSLRTGLVTAALKEGTGSATLNPSGSFSGATDLEYTIEIDSVAGGAEIGQATFRWSDGSGGWNASGVLTSAVNITLNNGVQINWTAGAGADFVIADTWYLKGVNLFNAGKMIDLDRDHRYRSWVLEAPNTITIDLATAQEVKAFILYDHNLSSTATITLQGDAAATFDSDGGNPQFTEAVTWGLDKILHYLSTATTKRYWRIRINDVAGNADGFIEIGELFLGSYIELSRNYAIGFRRTKDLIVTSNRTPYGVGRDHFYNVATNFDINFRVMLAADITLLEAMITAITDRSAGTYDPFWFDEDPDEADKIWMMKIKSLPTSHRGRTWYDMGMKMEEVLRSV